MKKLNFTLIELLVVIAIIAILAAMLLPALSKAREKSRVSACQSNEKNISTAIGMYCDDSQDILPHNGTMTVSNNTSGDRVTSWAEKLFPYLQINSEQRGFNKNFTCPSSSELVTVNTAARIRDVSNYYTLHGELSGNDSDDYKVQYYVKRSRQKMVSQYILGFDRNRGWATYSSPIKNLKRTSVNGPYDQELSYRAPHSTGRNYFFLDGHVKQFTGQLLPSSDIGWRPFLGAPIGRP